MFHKVHSDFLFHHFGVPFLPPRAAPNRPGTKKEASITKKNTLHPEPGKTKNKLKMDAVLKTDHCFFVVRILPCAWTGIGPPDRSSLHEISLSGRSSSLHY
jgi:hypothetical protein